MSVDMYLDLSQSQADSTGRMIDRQLEAYDVLEQALQNFVNSSEDLKGAAYDSARDLVSSDVLTLLAGGRLLSEKVKAAVTKFPEAFSSQVAPESLQESQLRADIAMLSSQIDAAQDHLSHISSSKMSSENKHAAMDQQHSLISGLEESKQKLEEKLEKLLAFHASSPALFSDIEALDAAIKAGSAQVQNAWDSGQGKFRLLGNDPQWKEEIKDTTFAQGYNVQRPEGMSDNDWKTYKHTLRTQAEALRQDGWTEDAVKDGYIQYLNDHYSTNNGSVDTQLKSYYETVHTFGSDIFITMWNIDAGKLNSYDANERPEKAQTLLNIAMTYTGMPQELNGSAEQTRAILDKMSDSLAPHDKFWDTFAQTVQAAYPDDLEEKKDGTFKSNARALGAPGGNEALKQRVNQFRYVISAQQAQWVRDWARERYGNDISDEQALAAYLNDGHKSSYDFDDTARFHNKVSERGTYPGGKKQVNYKILSKDFHTEFIISEDGSFVNEIDPEKDASENQNGVVNGASFNYADDGDKKAHERLDENAPKFYDPEYRDTMRENDGDTFLSPDKERYKDSEDKIYGFDGDESTYEREKAQKDEFKEMVGES
ncbi:hypothetical cytosolic protein [Streptococcus criceti]|uniref:LXG domain-containing protein n=1 Tax=Streptococcus criceti HS-6 TaxID=873449 RepID=G5JRP0_STRCG|nr:DUF3114 domain-containing protein [Streptococcus criceti]EHI75184.1 hypothetical protein STRCR_2049 [Streptococcus criceti HS-6]SUN42870.1 hypothetical cytosolic protein [Streptococcus criceti]